MKLEIGNFVITSTGKTGVVVEPEKFKIDDFVTEDRKAAESYKTSLLRKLFGKKLLEIETISPIVRLGDNNFQIESNKLLRTTVIKFRFEKPVILINDQAAKDLINVCKKHKINFLFK
jgi:hypothetical protein